MGLSIQDWGALGELIGAFAVVVTLVFLTLQIRQNTKSIEEGKKIALAQTYQGRAALVMDAVLRSSDPEFASIHSKYQQEREVKGPKEAIRSLTAAERWRYACYLNVWRTYTDNTFYQYQLGLLDDEYAEWGLGPKGALGTNAQDWRDWGIPLGRASFQEEVDRFLSENANAG